MPSLLPIIRIVMGLNGIIDLFMSIHAYLDRTLMTTLFFSSLSIPSQHGLQSLEMRILLMGFVIVGAARLNAAINIHQRSAYDLGLFSYLVEGIFFALETFFWKSTIVNVTIVPIGVTSVMTLLLLSYRGTALRTEHLKNQ